jgi:hypothetical protein
MAMTKKEQAEFDAALDRANTLAALRWTWPVEKDVPVPSGWAESTTGWDFNAYSVKVEQMWSEASSHGPGAMRAGIASQRGCELFSTRLLALRALRHAVENDSAGKLRKIDEQIELENSKKEPT